MLGLGPAPGGQHDYGLGVAEQPPPPLSGALVVSIAFGVIGLVLIVVGVIADVGGLILAGCAAGVLSLIAALVWRSQLIEAWRQRQQNR